MEPGTVLGGRYEIAEEIGKGGNGIVYRAVQKPLGRDVAIKIMLPTNAAGVAERFAREATLVKRLEHPNTVRLYDFGTTEDGLPYMVFELLRGRSLEQEVAKGPLPPARVAAIAAQMLKSLMEAHGLGIVHRDVKPSNVMLVTYSGEKDFVKVLDFGVARPMAPTRGGSITREGQIIGSAPYMAPEQVRGERVDALADVYAVGLVLAEALAGAPVYDGPSEVHIWLMHTQPGPAPIAPLAASSALGPIIARAVEKDASKRYPSAAEMLEDVEAVLATMEAGVPPTDPMPQAVIGPPPSTDRERFANRATAIAEPKAARAATPRESPRRALALVLAGVLVVGVAVALLVLAPSRQPLETPRGLPPQPAWFTDFGRRVATTEWRSAAPPRRTHVQGVDELTMELRRDTRRAEVHLWSFPEGAEEAAEKRAASETAAHNAVHRAGAHVASVHVDGDALAARRLLDEIDRVPPRVP